jgi:hypothetical protein
MSFGKLILSLFGFLLFGIGLLLVISGLIFSSLQSNLENYNWIVEESVDIFFEENEGLILAELGGDYSELCEADLEEMPEGFCDNIDNEITGYLDIAKEEIKTQAQEEFRVPLNYNFNVFYYFSIFFFIGGFLAVFFGYSKSIFKTFRGLFLQIGAVFLVVYFLIWKIVGMRLSQFYEMLNIDFEEIGVFTGLIEELVERLLFEPLRSLLIVFLVLGIIGIIGFIIFLVLSFVLRKKK